MATRKIINFLCDENLIKAFDNKLPEGMNRTDALLILMRAVVEGKLRLFKKVTKMEGVEWQEV